MDPAQTKCTLSDQLSKDKNYYLFNINKMIITTVVLIRSIIVVLLPGTIFSYFSGNFHFRILINFDKIIPWSRSGHYKFPIKFISKKWCNHAEWLIAINCQYNISIISGWSCQNICVLIRNINYNGICMHIKFWYDIQWHIDMLPQPIFRLFFPGSILCLITR